MMFYDVLKILLTTANNKIRRRSWNRGSYVCKSRCLVDDVEELMLKLVVTENVSIFYTPKQEDILADDWEIVHE